MQPRLDESVDALENYADDRRHQWLRIVYRQNRREACRSATVRDLIDQSIAHLKEQEKQLNKAIQVFIKADEVRDKDAYIQSVRGAGPITSAAFLACARTWFP